MSFASFAVESIEVKAKDGSSKGTLTGPVELVAGEGVSLQADPATKTVTIAAGSVYLEEDSYYRKKFEAVVNGGALLPDYEFSGAPYYVSKINGKSPNQAYDFDFLDSPCGQIGVWYATDPIGAPDGPGSILNPSGALEILDICPACVDCVDYYNIKGLAGRIEAFQNWDINRNLYDDEPPPGADAGELALYKQYQALLAYWNFQVHMQCIPLRATRAHDSYFTIDTGYYCKGSAPKTVTQTIIIHRSLTSSGSIPPGEEEDYQMSVTITHVDSKPKDQEPSISDVDLAIGQTFDTDAGQITIAAIDENSLKIQLDYPALSTNEYVFLQLSIRQRKPMEHVDVWSRWANSHLTTNPGDTYERTEQNVIGFQA